MTFDELGDLSPWDSGKLRAHQISACWTTQDLRLGLTQAQSRRQGWLCRVLVWRKDFLDGFINGLQKELNLRERNGQA